MKISITDRTPAKSTLEFMRFEDVFGSVLLTRGWR